MVSTTVAGERPLAAMIRRFGRPGATRPIHRDLQGGAARAAVLGACDGLITNVSLILGVAGAGSSHGTVVRLVGVAGLLAGSFSMAAGELVSVRAQAELVQRELDVEREELANAPEAEEEELVAMYRVRGVPEDDARTVARILSATAHLALDTHARLELGVDPSAQASPRRAALASFASFAGGALVPLVAWFFAVGPLAVAVSIGLSGLGALLLGAVIGASTGRGVLRTALRQLAAVVVASGVTYAVGSLLGVGTS